jgi:DNA repair protein RecO (recombination protein O)
VIFLNERRFRSYKTDALIIGQRKFGDYDKILTILSKDYGKVQIIAKGVLKPTSPLVYHVDLLNFTNLMISKGKNLDILIQAQTINSFESIRNDYDKLSKSFYMLEIIDKFIIISDSISEIFDITLTCFSRINDGHDIDLNVQIFELSILKFAGVLPEFNNCLHCLKKVLAKNAVINFNVGGILCSNCSDNFSDNINVSENCIKVIRAMLFTSYEIISRIKINKKIKIEIDSILTKFILINANSSFKSQKMFDHLSN